MDKIWLSQYPEGVAETINADQFPSLGALFESSARSYATKPAYTNLGVTYSYAELEVASRNFAAYLQNELGLGKGHKLALMLPNLLQYPIALFGALRAGLTVVNVNPLYTPRELEHQLKDSAADAIVILANFADTLAEIREQVAVQHIIVTEVGDACPMPKRALVNLAVRYLKRMVPDYRIPEAVSWTGAMSAGRKYSFRSVAVQGDDIAFLQYTGGTTGVAKGAMLSHRNMVANVLQCTAWFQPFLGKGEETIVTALPLYHIFSLSVNCLTFARIGGHNLLITNPRDMKGFVKTLSKTPFTAITGVNTLFNGLLNTPGFRDLDFSNLHLCIGGGMAVHESVATRWQEVTGMPLLEGYGLTETAPVVAVMPLDAKAFSGKIGLPVPSTEVSIRDEEGRELGPDEPGELFVRGPQVMLGYLGRPEATANSLADDGWFATGDMASIDDKGYLKIVDRKKDMILVSGFNVYPNEIEDVVAAHPGVFEVAAIGVPDDVKGEVVKIVVVRSDPGLTEEELINYCRDNLTGYKVPKIVEFREEIPKSNVGKILRRELRDEQGS